MAVSVGVLSVPQGGDLPQTIVAVNRAFQSLGIAMQQVQGAVTPGGGTGPYSIYPLAPNSVGSTQIDAGAVINSKIAADAVQTTNILLGAVTTLKIANAAVTTAQVAVNTLTGGLTGNLAVGTITNDNLVTNTIQANSIAAATILGTNIAASTITGGNIAATTITAGLLNVLTLSAITADMGAITAGTIVLSTTGFIRGGQTGYATGTGWWLGYDSTAYKLSIGSSTNFIKFDGTNMFYTGGSSPNTVIIDTTGFAVGVAGARRVAVGTFAGNAASFNFYDSTNTSLMGMFLTGTTVASLAQAVSTGAANLVTSATEVKLNLTNTGSNVLLSANAFGFGPALYLQGTSGALQMGLFVQDTATGNSSLTGQGVTLPNGSTTTPALNFGSQTNTGLYLFGASDMRFVIAGSAQLVVQTAQTVVLNRLKLGDAYVATPQTSSGYVLIRDSAGVDYKMLVST